ncbi:MAG: nicotinate-nucleotide pyrophosphorylase (carboxylating) [Bacteroidia bacterium]|jgi:nicotinate-nucleotide pyrophosphorylase (carboxylating)
MEQFDPKKHAPNTALVLANVRAALTEDIGDGDITAALIPATERATGKVITREAGIMCGTPWVTTVFAELDSRVKLEWLVQDGAAVAAGDTLFTLSGPARSLLTGERAALNFLQLLSGTASTCARYAGIVADTKTKLLDTRKTIPGLRIAQKYAVRCGGCHNHRIGLYDAFLIKENHINACGGIGKAIDTARQNAPDKPVEVEVETREELEQALAAGADRVMLDNFSLADMTAAVQLNNGKAELEASGNVTDATLLSIANTGVDYISIGALTKDCKAMDLSMRLD